MMELHDLREEGAEIRGVGRWLLLVALGLACFGVSLLIRARIIEKLTDRVRDGALVLADENDELREENEGFRAELRKDVAP